MQNKHFSWLVQKATPYTSSSRRKAFAPITFDSIQYSLLLQAASLKAGAARNVQLLQHAMVRLFKSYFDSDSTAKISNLQPAAHLVYQAALESCDPLHMVRWAPAYLTRTLPEYPKSVSLNMLAPSILSMFSRYSQS